MLGELVHRLHAMFSVEVDQTKRLVVISAAGRVTKDEVKHAAVQMREMLEDFAPEFRALTDFRWLEWMQPAAAEHVAEIMKVWAEKGVHLVVRVVPDPRKDIGLNILSQFHYGPEIQIVTFETLADAIQLLSEQTEPT